MQGDVESNINKHTTVIGLCDRVSYVRINIVQIFALLTEVFENNECVTPISSDKMLRSEAAK